jgi:hypothetical protein
MQIPLEFFHLVALEPRVCHASVVYRSSREIEQTLYVKITTFFFLFFFPKPLMSKKTASAQQEPVKTADPVVDPSEDELFTNILMKFFPRRLGPYTVIHSNLCVLKLENPL